MDGAVVRALTSHQHGPGSIPGVDTKCWMCLLLVLVPAQGVLSRYSSLTPSKKPTFPYSDSDNLEIVDNEGPLSRCAPEIPICFIYFSIYKVPREPR